MMEMDQETRLKYINMMAQDLVHSCEEYIDHEYEGRSFYSSGNYLNKNHGKTAIKRKITMLRQELLNFKNLLDE